MTRTCLFCRRPHKFTVLHHCSLKCMDASQAVLSLKPKVYEGGINDVNIYNRILTNEEIKVVLDAVGGDKLP